MARISEDELTRLKESTSLERLVTAKGLKLKPHGQDLICHCPFHDDKTPSFIVSPKKNLWHCLGACQTGGSVVDWVMKIEGVSFRHAIELLREDSPSLAAALPASRMGRPPADGRSCVKKSTVTHLQSAIAQSANTQAALRQAMDYYHATLKTTPDALAYLEKRGLKSNAVIEHFRLGFCDRTLGYRLPQKNRKDGAAIRDALQEVGILRKSGHEHFRGSLTIPLFNAEGEIVEMYGRKINDNLRQGTAKHLYLPGPHRGVFNLPAFKASKEIIVCEALIDALTFWCVGFRNVTSTYGAGGLSSDHLAAFEQYGIERVLIAYDRDEAGDKGAETLAKTLGGRGIDTFRIKFPKGMDANAYAQQVQPASQSLGVCIRSASWMGNGKAPKVRTAETVLHKVQSTAEYIESTAESAEELQSLAETLPSPCAVTDSINAQGPSSNTLLLAAKSARQETPSSAESPPSPMPVPASPPSSSAATPAPAPPPSLAEPPPAITLRLPESPHSTIDAEIKAQEIIMRFGARRFRVRGLGKNMSYDLLRVNLLCSISSTERFHVDTFDLYSARHRTSYLKQAAIELDIEMDILKKDLGRVLLKLEELQDEQIQSALQPKDEVPEMTDDEREEALALLRDPRLLDRIIEDFARCGVVGEETNKLTGYLAAVSRKLHRPLAIIIQSSSAAGKSSLMDAILSLMPEEERVQYSAMTGQSLFYMGETNLKHKILAIVEEEGAERASYALKLLQSEGELTIASTGKDATTGKLVTHEYHVEGPVMIFLTTTAIEIDNELLNRCLILSVNEGRKQTQAIHRQQRQRRTLRGLSARHAKSHVQTLHRNAQRLLKPVWVVNPFAEKLSFIDTRTRTRRDNDKYLTLIESIALLRQYQRETKTTIENGKQVSYIEVIIDDIEIANGLAEQVLSRSLDELPPQTRRFFQLLKEMVQRICVKKAIDPCDYRFSRREMREATGWSQTQVKVHLDRLCELEYVFLHCGGRGQRFVYELLHSDAGPGQVGLLDITQLKKDAAHTLSTKTTSTVQTYRGVSVGNGAVSDTPKPLIAKANGETYRGVGVSTIGAEIRDVENRTVVENRSVHEVTGS